MAADDPEDDKKEFNRLRDNAGLEHKRKEVPDPHSAPRGEVGTRPRLEFGGPGGMSQSKGEYKHKDPPQQTPGRQTQNTNRLPEKSDTSGKGKQFHKRELSEQFKERSGAAEKSDESQKKHFHKRDLSEHFKDRSR